MSKTNFKTALRRIAAYALAMLFVMTMAMTVSAKQYEDIKDDYAYTEQVDILSDIGIIVGTSDTTFSPDVNVTREQMAMLLFRTMLGRGNSGIINTTAFKDLYDPTYNGAISWANAAGYIIGTSASTFNPKGGITLQDAMTMIVRALGQSNTAMDRGYPWTYIDAAVRLGLDNDLNGVDYTKTLTRGETAALLYNALTAEYLVPKTLSNNNTYYISTSIIEYVFGYDISDCTVVATNNFSIENYSLAVKTGYVTVEKADGTNMTVSFDQFGLTGSSDSWLGKTLKLIYKYDAKTKLVSVFGATYTGSAASFDAVTVAADASYVEIGGVKYNVVSTKSDALSTNQNELYVYAYDNDGKLEKLADNAALASKLGIFSITLIKDNTASAAADRALIKCFSFGKLELSGTKITIAGGLTEAQLTGGFINTAKAAYGDYVLYYFNAANKSLEIAEKLTPADSALITRLTTSTAVIGGTEYKLGCPAAGISAASIASQLSVGNNVSIIAKNGYILYVVNAVSTVESKYLVAASATVPVYNNGIVRYAMTANIAGVSQTILTNSASVVIDGVYRYTVDANGIYTLYPSGDANFTQSGDISLTHTFQNAQTLSMTGAPCYTFQGISFVTDADTIIIAKNAGGYVVKKGVCTSDITFAAGSSATAVFKDNAGNVDTLKFLYITNGDIARSDVSASYAKVLAAAGTEYADNTVYYLYTALNLNTGAISTLRSIYNGLTVGSVYSLDVSGNILNIAANVLKTGTVNGYTASTVTIDGTVYALSANLVIEAIGADNSVTTLALSDVLGDQVTFYAVNGAAVLIFE